MANEFLHIVDVVVEVKGAVRQGHGPSVFPVGDVDLVVLEHGLDGIAQQRGIVTRQGGNNQDCRLVLEPRQRGRVIGKTLEAAQLAKWFVNFNPLMDGDAGALHIQGLNVKRWFFVVFAQSVQQAVTGCHTLGKRVLTDSRQGVAVELCGGLRKINKGLHQRALGFIDLVKHGENL